MINKFINIKQIFQLYRAFCLSLTDQGNVNVEIGELAERYDKLMQITLKHCINMKRTTLNANVRITFGLLKWNDRKRLDSLAF